MQPARQWANQPRWLAEERRQRGRRGHRRGGRGSRLTRDRRDRSRAHAQPGAKRTEIQGLHGDALKIRVAAAPVDGAANDELALEPLDRVQAPGVERVRGEPADVRMEAPRLVEEQALGGLDPDDMVAEIKERLGEELVIIDASGLAPYFLVVRGTQACLTVKLSTGQTPEFCVPVAKIKAGTAVPKALESAGGANFDYVVAVPDGASVGRTLNGATTPQTVADNAALIAATKIIPITSRVSRRCAYAAPTEMKFCSCTSGSF